MPKRSPESQHADSPPSFGKKKKGGHQPVWEFPLQELSTAQRLAVSKNLAKECQLKHRAKERRVFYYWSI
jgi:hypothetical protein